MTVLQQQYPTGGEPAARMATVPAPAARQAATPNATFVARRDITESLAVFNVVLDAPLAGYRPGQYVSLGVFVHGALVQRPYSVVATSADGYRIELFIRHVPGGALSPVLWAVAPGTRVRIGPPKGLFVLDPADVRPRLFVATGTGLAPMLAMLDALRARNDGAPNALIHGVSYHSELAYAETIEGYVGAGLDVWYVPSVSRPDDPRNSGWSGTSGRADAVLQRVVEADPSLAGGVAYLCGNAGMIEACSATLAAAGMAPEDIRSETFHAPSAAVIS